MDLTLQHKEAGQIRAIKDIPVAKIGFVSASGFAEKEDGSAYIDGAALYD